MVTGNPYQDRKRKEMEERLTALLKAPLSLTITDNTRAMISVRRKNEGYAARLHHMFLGADHAVLESLSEYMSGKSRKGYPVLKAFIKENEDKIRRPLGPPRPRRTRIVSRGRYFDLQDRFQRLNGKYFQGALYCLITWGSIRNRTGQKSVRLGSYSPTTKTIRINPVLDRSFVPLYVLDDVIHHEMLHHVLGTKRLSGRRSHHHRAFRNMEERFVHHGKAKEWIKKNLSRLVAS